MVLPRILWRWKLTLTCDLQGFQSRHCTAGIYLYSQWYVSLSCTQIGDRSAPVSQILSNQTSPVTQNSYWPERSCYTNFEYPECSIRPDYPNSWYHGDKSSLVTSLSNRTASMAKITQTIGNWSALVILILSNQITQILGWAERSGHPCECSLTRHTSDC